MSEEVKPCPFCGGMPDIYPEDQSEGSSIQGYGIPHTEMNSKRNYMASCCGMGFSGRISFETWQSRPGEESLQKTLQTVLDAEKEARAEISDLIQTVAARQHEIDVLGEKLDEAMAVITQIEIMYPRELDVIRKELEGIES